NLPDPGPPRLAGPGRAPPGATEGQAGPPGVLDHRGRPGAARRLADRPRARRELPERTPPQALLRAPSARRGEHPAPGALPREAAGAPAGLRGRGTPAAARETGASRPAVLAHDASLRTAPRRRAPALERRNARGAWTAPTPSGQTGEEPLTEALVDTVIRVVLWIHVLAGTVALLVAPGALLTVKG